MKNLVERYMTLFEQLNLLYHNIFTKYRKKLQVFLQTKSGYIAAFIDFPLLCPLQLQSAKAANLKHKELT